MDNSVALSLTLMKYWSENNILEPEVTSTGSGRIALWTCQNNHEFERVVRKYVKSQTCPYCKGIKVIKGENDCLTLYPELVNHITENDLSKLSEIGKASTILINWICTECSEQYSMKVSSYLESNKKCKDCRKQRDYPAGFSILEAFPEISTMWSESNKTSVNEIPYGSSKYWIWECSLGHEFKAVAHKMNRKKNKICPICNSDKIEPGFNDLETLYPEIAAQWSSENLLKPSQIGAGSNHYAKLTCSENHHFERIIANHITAKGRCPQCQTVPPGSSLLELEILDFVRSIASSLDTSSTPKNISSIKVINRSKELGVEIDIWIPSFNLGIEVNGDYWHSDKISLKNLGMTATERHLKKISKVEEKGATLLFIWESDWRNSQQNVRDALCKTLQDLKNIDEILKILTKG